MICRLRWLVVLAPLAFTACSGGLPKEDAALIDAAVLLMKAWDAGSAEPAQETKRRITENGVEFTHVEKNALIASAVELFQDVKDSAWQREKLTLSLPEKCLLKVRSAIDYSVGNSKDEFRAAQFEPPKVLKYDLRNVTRLNMDLVKRFYLWAKVDIEGRNVACTQDECQDKVTFRSKTAVRGDASVAEQSSLLEAFERAIQVVKNACPLRPNPESGA
jgi:hypothetical protein